MERMHPLRKIGIVHVTGAGDSGKTTLALTSGATPERTAFFDDDIKASGTAQMLSDMGHKFGMYANLTKGSGDKLELESLQYTLDLIDDIKPGDFDVIIFDSFARFENTLHPYVSANMGKFRRKWSPKGDIKGAQIWQSAHQFETTILQRLLDRAPLVIITTHLKNHTISGRRTGKMIPDCKKSLMQKSSMRVWLRAGDPEPSGLLLKRLSRPQITEDGGIEFVSVTPRKMAPFTWKALRKYWDMPSDDKPRDDEKLTDEELSVIENTLTEDQLSLLKYSILFGNGEGEDDDDLKYNKDVVNRVVEMKESGKTMPWIASQLDISVREVVKIISKSKGE